MMKISEIIKKLNDAFAIYGDIPVTMSILEVPGENIIEDIQADDKSVTLYDFEF